MLYFDRQMVRLKEGFNQLNTQMGEREVQFITVDKVLQDKMREMNIHSRIYE